jgi:hypothetical protein
MNVNCPRQVHRNENVRVPSCSLGQIHSLVLCPAILCWFRLRASRGSPRRSLKSAICGRRCWRDQQLERMSCRRRIGELK